MAELSKIIRARREQMGLSQQKLAELAGVSQTTIDKIERGLTKNSRFLTYINAALQLGNAKEFLDETDNLAKQSQLARRSPDVKVFAAEDETENILFRKIKSLDGSSKVDPARCGFFSIGATPFDAIPSYSVLGSSEGIYAVYLSNNAMSPEFEVADVAYANPALPPAPFGTCIFIASPAAEGDLSLRLLGRFLGSNRDDWDVAVMNPVQHLKLPKADWKAAHRVVLKLYRR